jgi:hypothetical protein
MTTLKAIGAAPITLDPQVRVVVAGYTGRDEAAVRNHIDELAEIGVTPPPQVPMVYPMPVELLSTAADIEVTGANSSGEVEPVYIRAGGNWYFGVGSDHTDRTLETVDIGESKRACPKPVGARVIPVADWVSFDFDNCRASCTVDGKLYQQGALAGLRRPDALLELLTGRQPELADGDLVVFGGTLPLIDGQFIPGKTWELSITLPGGVTLSHRYRATIRTHENPKD